MEIQAHADWRCQLRDAFALCLIVGDEIMQVLELEVQPIELARNAAASTALSPAMK